jgi:hypothetical protein
MGHNVQTNEHNIDGKVIYISQPRYVSEKLSLRTLVLEVFEGTYGMPVPFTFKNSRMDVLKDIKEGDWVNVQFHLAGFKGKGDGEPKYYAENSGQTCIKG